MVAAGRAWGMFFQPNYFAWGCFGKLLELSWFRLFCGSSQTLFAFLLMEKDLSLDSFSKAEFQALVWCFHFLSFFLFFKVNSRLSVLVAYVCTCCRDILKMEDNLIIHSKLIFGVLLFSPSFSSSMKQYSQGSTDRKSTLRIHILKT